MPLLQTDFHLNAVPLLEELQGRHPGQLNTSVQRTLQRRMRLWRTQFGAEQKVYFAQEHPHGRQGISDFTLADALNVEIADAPFTQNSVRPPSDPYASEYSSWHAEEAASAMVDLHLPEERLRIGDLLRVRVFPRSSACATHTYKRRMPRRCSAPSSAASYLPTLLNLPCSEN